jgi:ketosteroid isomerase-like protein
MAKKATTESVIQHHVQALMSRNLDEIMKDYCEDSVMCSPMGVSKGLKGIRESFTGALGMLTPEAMGNMKSIKQDIVGEYAYALWSALPAVKFAGDTFHIHNGKILMQSFISPM